MASTPTRVFVIRPLAADPGEPPSRLNAIKLASAHDGWRVETTGGASEHAAWQALQSGLAPAWCAIPVIEDDEGGERFPTGRIGVRFRAAASDAALAELATSAGLRLVQRTKFNDRQAVYAASDAAAFLPALVARLAQHAEVEAAWLDAESAFRRSP